MTLFLEARSNYLAAGALEQARKIISAQYQQCFTRAGAIYREIERLNLELLRLEEHAVTLAWLGPQLDFIESCGIGERVCHAV